MALPWLPLSTSVIITAVPFPDPARNWDDRDWILWFPTDTSRKSRLMIRGLGSPTESVSVTRWLIGLWASAVRLPYLFFFLFFFFRGWKHTKCSKERWFFYFIRLHKTYQMSSRKCWPLSRNDVSSFLSVFTVRNDDLCLVSGTHGACWRRPRTVIQRGRW